MKYFFLSEGWTTGRIWEFGGLWNELAWNRKPLLQRQSLYIQENGENLWLYKTEDAVLMVEVMPQATPRQKGSASSNPSIGQVVLKRLLTAEQVVERLCTELVFHPDDSNDFPITDMSDWQEGDRQPNSAPDSASDLSSDIKQVKSLTERAAVSSL